MLFASIIFSVIAGVGFAEESKPREVLLAQAGGVITPGAGVGAAGTATSPTGTNFKRPKTETGTPSSPNNIQMEQDFGTGSNSAKRRINRGLNPSPPGTSTQLPFEGNPHEGAAK